MSNDKTIESGILDNATAANKPTIICVGVSSTVKYKE